MKESNIKIFEKALLLWDEQLEKKNHDTIVIKAIGGFAMLYNGIREHGYTIDIDSLTVEFDEEVKNLIKQIGIDMDLDEEWLNTDCATLNGFLSGLEPIIEWEKVKRYNRIDLYFADNWGLIETKAKTIHDGGLVPRKTDKKDLLLLLKIVNINNIDEVKQNKKLKFIKEKYERTYMYLENIKEW